MIYNPRQHDAQLRRVVCELAAALTARKLVCAVAESCTGGMLGAALTSKVGASRWFAGGVIAYANNVKERVLHVSPQTLRQHGAVSEESVLQMADGVCRCLHVPVGMSISGIAGPDGGTEEKPVGLVWMGFAVNGKLDACHAVFDGSRDAVRQQATLAAVRGLVQRLG